MNISHLTRRDALKTAGVLGVGAATLGIVPGTSQAANSTQPLLETEIGFRDGEYVLPPLPYPANALEPYIDEETMKIHHDILHRNYVNGTNRTAAALAKIASGEGDTALTKAYERDLAFFGSGHALHTLFWNNMKPDGGGKPDSPELAAAIDRDFGSLENFFRQFTAAATGVEGSGWALLSYEPISGRLIVLQVEKQQDLTFQGATPLLGCDVWEHAYFLKYKAARAEYVEAWKNTINWEDVAKRFARATVAPTPA